MKSIVSIITVSCNSEKTIERTIKSVLEQSYSPVEYIVIDGKSTDNTVDILKHYDDQIDYWVSREDEGLYHAMQEGAEQAHGEWIWFLNSDDWIAPDAVERMADYAQDTGCDNVYGKMIIDEGAYYTVLGERNYDRLFKLSFSHPATMISRKSFFTLGGFDTRYRISADYNFFLRAAKMHMSFCHIDAVVVHMSGGGLSDRFSTLIRRLKEHFLSDRRVCGIYFALRKNVIYAPKTMLSFFLKRILGVSGGYKLLNVVYSHRRKTVIPKR